MEFDQEILNIFIEEARDLLSNWERECLNLEKNPGSQDFDGLFRVAHNLKGSSKAIGLENFGNVIHAVEDIVNLLREKKALIQDSQNQVNEIVGNTQSTFEKGREVGQRAQRIFQDISSRINIINEQIRRINEASMVQYEEIKWTRRQKAARTSPLKF